MQDEKLYYDRTSGRYFRMTDQRMKELLKEKQRLLNNDLVKEAKIGSYLDFVEEFVNPFLPDDKKIRKGDCWSNKPTAEAEIDFDKPFGVIVKF